MSFIEKQVYRLNDKQQINTKSMMRYYSNTNVVGNEMNMIETALASRKAKKYIWISLSMWYLTGRLQLQSLIFKRVVWREIDTIWKMYCKLL